MSLLPFQYHVFVCEQKKPEGAPSCLAKGAARVIDALRAEVAARGLVERVAVTPCGSLGLCERGPNMVVYPEGAWYSGVTAADVPEIVAEHFVNGHPVERLARKTESELRDEMQANAAKRAAAMRAIEASGMMSEDLAERFRAFQESRVLLTAVELDVFSAVGSGATAADVAAKAGTDARATEMLLDALVSLEVLTKNAGFYANTPAMARYLSAAGANDARGAMMHTVGLWDTWSRLTEIVRAGSAAARPRVADRGSQWTQAFIAAMHHRATASAPRVAAAVGAERVHHMLDIGGGSGAYSIAFAQANPQLRAEILDLPTVTPLADRYIRDAGVSDRVATRAGDLGADSYGSGYDLVFISAICHMLGEEGNRSMLRKAYNALEPGGRVVVQDFILNPERTSPRWAAMFAINMLVGTADGNSYTEAEYAAWLSDAGFTEVERVRLPGPADLMIGTRS